MNLITEEGTLNDELKQYPTASANIAIFGSQSSGKSTLVNQTFNTHFPVLDSKIKRQRCTKGVWMRNSMDFNIIDTEGFDSMQRKPEQKILQKQIALLCLALADVIIINMWMIEVGRYQGSHSHILKSIIKVSQRLISSQQKKIIFVIKDCPEDANRNVLRQQLEQNIKQIISSSTPSIPKNSRVKSKSLKLTFQYHFMSHYFYKRAAFHKEAKELKNMIKVKKSHFFNYSKQDRVIYIKDLWAQITSAENQVDLKSIQDALRTHSLQRLKGQTLQKCQQMIQKATNLQKYKNLQRFSQTILKSAQKCFKQARPIHTSDKQVQKIIIQIKQFLEYPIQKQFTYIILPFQASNLINEFQKTLQSCESSRQLQKIIINKRKQITDTYKRMISTHIESFSLIKRFSQKINQVSLKYQGQITHLFHIFQNKLQKLLNQQVDRLLSKKQIHFDGTCVEKLIKKICVQFQYNQQEINFKQMWQKKITHRAINQRLPEKVQEMSRKFTDNISIWNGDQTTNILAFHRKLQKDCEEFCHFMANYFQDQPTAIQSFDKLKDQIQNLMEKSLQKQRSRFHVTMIIFASFMWFCYGQFVYLMKMLPIKKRKRRYWINFYIFILTLMIFISIYNRRNQIKRLIGWQK